MTVDEYRRGVQVLCATLQAMTRPCFRGTPLLELLKGNARGVVREGVIEELAGLVDWTEIDKRIRSLT